MDVLVRARKADGRGSDAQQQFQSIAGQFNFYGQLASEELGNRITIPTRTTVTDAEAMAMRSRAGFTRAKKFYDLNLRFEGNREWNWELRGMNDRDLLAAAEYARKIELLDRTVNTSDAPRPSTISRSASRCRTGTSCSVPRTMSASTWHGPMA
jgi:soluble lytic murein transglycosylase